MARPKIQLSFTDRDLGMGRILKEAAKLRKKPYVKAGITEAKGARLQEGTNKTVAFIGTVHEYGSEAQGIPERSFIRSTVSKFQGKYNKRIQSLYEGIFDASGEMTVEKALALIGQEVSSDIKATIRDKIAPALKASTIRRKNAAQIEKAHGTLRSLEAKGKALSKGDLKRENKASNLVLTGGESTPLIDTGQMINSITYDVIMDGDHNAEHKEG